MFWKKRFEKIEDRIDDIENTQQIIKDEIKGIKVNLADEIKLDIMMELEQENLVHKLEFVEEHNWYSNELILKLGDQSIGSVEDFIWYLGFGFTPSGRYNDASSKIKLLKSNRSKLKEIDDKLTEIDNLRKSSEEELSKVVDNSVKKKELITKRYNDKIEEILHSM